MAAIQLINAQLINQAFTTLLSQVTGKQRWLEGGKTAKTQVSVVSCPTFRYGHDLGDVGSVHHERRLSVRFLVEFNFSRLFVDGKPVIWVRGFGVPEAQ